MLIDGELRLARVRRGFRKRLAEEAAELSAIPAEELAGETVERVRWLAHRLTGSAAQFGYPDVAASAEALARDPAVEDPDSPAETKLKIRALVRAIDEALRQGPAERSAAELDGQRRSVL